MKAGIDLPAFNFFLYPSGTITREMKLPLIFIFILPIFLFPVSATAQVTVLTDDFEDFDLTLNPRWDGDLSDFTFHTEDGNVLLRLNAEPDPSRSQIAISSHTTAGSWEFYFRQEYSPSNFNRAFIFLIADRRDLNYLDGSSVNGYAIRTGDNQSPRKIRLVRFDNGNQTELIESDTELQEGAGYRIRVERTIDGVWSLYVASGREPGNEFQIEGEPITDSEHTSSAYTGLLVRYSSTNTQGFYFDDLVIRNSEPFSLINAEVISSFQIEATFSYPVDTQTIASSNFTIVPFGAPAETEAVSSGNRVILTYLEPVPDGEFLLRANGVLSLFGEELTGAREFSFSFTNPFRILSYEAISNRSIELQFSHAPDPATSIPLNFLLNEHRYPDSVDFLQENILLLQFNQLFPPGPITVSIQGLQSTNGWLIPDNTEITTYLFGDAVAGDLVINEILFRRQTSSGPQFIELFNTRSDPIDLENWKLETDRGSADIPPSTVIRESGFVVFTDNQNFSTAAEEIRYLPGFQALRTTGDAVVLKDPDGMVIDSLYYQPGWGGNEPGRSLERKDPGAISVDPANWGGSLAESGSTPLMQNTQYETDLDAPELNFATYQPLSSSILLRFNEFVDLDSSLEILVSGRPSGFQQPDSLPGNEFLVQLNDPHPDQELIAEVSHIRDYQGNTAARQYIPVSHPVREGDLVFNEIMYDPLSDDFDGLPNQSEYLELFNPREHAISLEGLYIHERPDENGEAREMQPLSTHSKWIPAKGHALLYPESGGMTFGESRTARFFGLGSSFAPHSLQFDRVTLSLPMGGREIHLADSTGQLIDSVHYLPEWHNPNLIDTKGISLERINPYTDTRDADNWGSSTLPTGGTPGRENSLFQSPAAQPSANSIVLEPNPFSPDGDGMEDRLFINYSFDDPDYMLRVRIYDRYGRLVRNLTHSHPSGLNGSLIWDGRSDTGVTGRIGIYIIHIEAVNGSTGQKREFKKTVVLARRF